MLSQCRTGWCLWDQILVQIFSGLAGARLRSHEVFLVTRNLSWGSLRLRLRNLEANKKIKLASLMAINQNNYD